MINRETGLPSNPLVETALKAIADWVSNYRSAIGSNNECGPDDVMRMDERDWSDPKSTPRTG